jgi:sugar lactone lactonase YvrE
MKLIPSLIKIGAASAVLAVVALWQSAQAQRTTDSVASNFGQPQLLHSWTKMLWNWRTAAEQTAYEQNGVFKAATLAGVDSDRRGNLYVTTPRWIDARVPATLNKVVKVNGQSVLEPFPSWQANTVGDAATRLQNVLGLEVDSKNRMWLVDMGWVTGVNDTPDGAQKIVVIDLNTGRELKRYAIPDSVADRKTSFLNDITIDEKREVAYITDSGNRSGSPVASGIIVYDFKSNTARRVLDRHPATQDDPARELTVMGERVLPGGRLAVGINGITLSADGNTVFWNITTGDALYSMPTSVLRDANATVQQLAAAITGPVRIGGGGDGLTKDAKGRLYLTHLSEGKVQVQLPGSSSLQTIAQGQGMEWPDSLSWDSRGGLLFSSNWLNRAFAGQMNFDQAAPNFRIWRVQTDSSKGYVK